MKKTGFAIFLIMCLSALAVSCDKVFPNDRLDFLWRLDRICFLNGTDFDGKECRERTAENVWYGFARDLVEVRCNAPAGRIGVLTDYGDSLRFDFSMYDSDSIHAELLDELHRCGLRDIVSTHSVEKLEGGEMILSDGTVRLFFTKW